MMNTGRRLAAAGLSLLALEILPGQAPAQIAKGKGKFVGSSLGSLRADFSKYWNQVTPENAGKWGSVEGSQGNYNWGPLDDIYNFAISNSYPYKHHNLVWGQQQPSWITSLDSAGQRAAVEHWIDTVAQRYGSCWYVDVVNEPFHAPPSYAGALGGAGATGWDWVITTFTWARKYFFPGVKLLINEYNILQDNTVTGNYLRLIDTLRARKLIDGIGVQGHYFEFRSPAGATPAYSYPLSTLQYNLDRLTATGLPVYISEFDINESADSTQLQNYQTYFPLFWNETGVAGITLWGYVQGLTWQTNAYLVRFDGSERPALQWLRRFVASPPRPVLVSPSGTTGEPRNPLLVWHPSSTALSYRVQVAAGSGFSPVLVDSTVTDSLLRVTPLASNTAYTWRVSALNDSGASSWSLPATFSTGDQILSVAGGETSPHDYALLQNYPNPWNPATTIPFTVPSRTDVRIVLLNVLGQTVKEIARGVYDGGRHTVVLDGRGLASGVYFYRMETPAFVSVRSLLLLK